MNELAVITRTRGESIVIGGEIRIMVIAAHRGKSRLEITWLSADLEEPMNVRRAEAIFLPEHTAGHGVAVIARGIGHSIVIGEAVQVTVTKAHRGKCRLKVKQLSSDPRNALSIERA